MLWASFCARVVLFYRVAVFVLCQSSRPADRPFRAMFKFNWQRETSSYTTIDRRLLDEYTVPLTSADGGHRRVTWSIGITHRRSKNTSGRGVFLRCAAQHAMKQMLFG